jgi:plastocyanin
MAVAVAALVFTAGCSTGSAKAGSASSTSSPTASAALSGSPTTAASGSTLTISEFAFSTLTVKPGAVVTVNNQDSVAHTVNVHGTTIDVTVGGGGHATFTAPTKPGTYPLTCDFHHSMHGMLTVAA